MQHKDLKIFAWLVFYNKILTSDNMVKRGWNLPSMCFLCRRECESVKHMFSECNFSLEVYMKVSEHFHFPIADWRETLQRCQIQNWIIRKGRGSQTEDVMLVAMFVC